MKDLNELLKANEQLAKRFAKLETTLATYHHKRELFEGLVLSLEKEFHIPYVWLTVIAAPETAKLIKNLQLSEILANRLSIAERTSFLKLVAHDTQPIITNTNLAPFYQLMPPKVKYFIRSICVAPVTCGGKIIGSFNHGDSCPFRYQPDMDHSLLIKLMVKVSAHLDALAAVKKNNR